MTDTVIETVASSLVDFSAAKRSQTRRIKQKLRRRRSKKVVEYKPDFPKGAPSSERLSARAPLHRSAPSAEKEALWSRLHHLSAEWLSMYQFQGIHHSAVRELLLTEGLAGFVGSEGNEELVLCPKPLDEWVEDRRRNSGFHSDSDAIGCLSAIVDEVESVIAVLGSQTSMPDSPVALRQPQFVSAKPSVRSSQTSPNLDTADTTRPPSAELGKQTPAADAPIQCSVNGVSISLNFKNVGNNDIIDIETYLQEKLDVLEFLQMDCNRVGKDSPSPPLGGKLEIFAPKVEEPAVSARKPLLSVNINSRRSSVAAETSAIPTPLGEWYGEGRRPKGGYFIGTPTGSSLNASVVSRAESQQENRVMEKMSRIGLSRAMLARLGTSDVLSETSVNEDSRVENEKNTRWETESSTSRKSSSRSRSNSVSSSGGVKRTSGMFQKGRFSRLLKSAPSDVSFANFSENDPSPKTAAPYVATGWWN